mmetsp:Transcript_28641/g.61420  ORF Transcript_28641/g.61420 Transcript_28641/m.61420 type:complete len:340 (+) Transcript_28641:354-1373(+)
MRATPPVDNDGWTTLPPRFLHRGDLFSQCQIFAPDDAGTLPLVSILSALLPRFEVASFVGTLQEARPFLVYSQREQALGYDRLESAQTTAFPRTNRCPSQDHGVQKGAPLLPMEGIVGPRCLEFRNIPRPVSPFEGCNAWTGLAIVFYERTGMGGFVVSRKRNDPNTDSFVKGACREGNHWSFAVLFHRFVPSSGLYRRSMGLDRKRRRRRRRQRREPRCSAGDSSSKPDKIQAGRGHANRAHGEAGTPQDQGRKRKRRVDHKGSHVPDRERRGMGRHHPVAILGVAVGTHPVGEPEKRTPGLLRRCSFPEKRQGVVGGNRFGFTNNASFPFPIVPFVE